METQSKVLLGSRIVICWTLSRQRTWRGWGKNWHFHPRDWYSHLADESSIPIPRLETIQNFIFAPFFSQIGSIYFFSPSEKPTLPLKNRLFEADWDPNKWPPAPTISELDGLRPLLRREVALLIRGSQFSAPLQLLCFVLFRFARWFVGLLHFPTMTSNFKIENLHFYLKQDSFKITLAAESIFKNIDMLLIF